MPNFYYLACTEQGDKVKGRESADNHRQVLSRLEEKKLYPIHIYSDKDAPKTNSVENEISRRLPVPQKKLSMMFDQLSMMLSSGISIVEALQSIEDQTPNIRLQETLSKIRLMVEEGIPLHIAMREQSDIFDEATLRIIEVGEHIGQLDVSLSRLSAMIEFDIMIQKRFSEATRYPKIVLSTLGAAACLLASVVVPRFANMYTNSSIALPLPTRILLGSYDVVRVYWPLIIAMGLVGFAVFLILKKHPATSRRIEETILRIPVWGALRLHIELSRIFRILSILIDSGVDILSSFKLISQISKTGIISAAIIDARAKLEKGQSMASALDDIPFFPRMARRMILLGEKSGKLSESLLKLSEIYEKDTQSKIKTISSLLEPLLIVLIGIIILIFALAIFLPMWDLIKVIK